jgi:hypothetical protein
MRNDAVRAGNDKIAALTGLLRSWGHDADDFQVEEDRNPALGEMLGLGVGVLIVRRRSTGEERLYPAGHAAGSAWFGSLVMDLARGHFRPAPRESLAQDSPADDPRRC